MMKIKEGFILRSLNGKNIVVAVGDMATQFNGLITLNSTATFLWKCLESGATEEELVAMVVSEYSLQSDEQARADVKAFVTKLLGAGILDE